MLNDPLCYLSASKSLRGRKYLIIVCLSPSVHLTAHVRVVRESEEGQKGGRRLRGNTRNIPGNFLCEILGNFLCEIPENFLCETSGERLRTSQSQKKTEGEYKKYPWEFPLWNPWEFPMWNPWEFPVWNKWWAVENLSVFCRTKWSRYSWKTKKKQMWVTKGGKTCGRLDSPVIYHCTSHFPNSLSTSHI